MAPEAPVLLGWARSAVQPRGAGLAQLAAHEIGAPVVQALLARSGIAAEAVDGLVCGNGLGAGGNPARMVALAAGLPDRVAAFSVDTQCCSGLDAVALGAGLIASGQAQLVVAGGAEAWSRAPIRQHRPREAGALPVAYERPAFAPDPARDPDLAQAAAEHAFQAAISRTAQDAFAILSHARTLAAHALLAEEIVPIGTATHDSYARALTVERVARMPVEAFAAASAGQSGDTRSCAVSRLSISPQADGAAFVLLASQRAAATFGCEARLRWCGGLALGTAPEMPLLAAGHAAQALLQRHGLRPDALWGVELHDAFAVQALAFAAALAIAPERLNRGGGGIARGHPIGASGAISLVRLLADMAREAPTGARGLAAVAAAGGLGSAALIEKL
ncbi:acetyl-CoA C-acyltransferase [Pseudorhodoferax soli]|uniref:Acetyl-CoA C-acetyltransferase n=1 Tax=Pseudorhodoferax soli TaxID=545864 RepID=A0A368XQ10_9BURK|nr:acetyl-CoA C-acyltransferase [Pseudorhodoferax soli]RCW68597.1 acetyl-CoA C-acetyltransferase [Pseudorhodoferax soli]